MGAGPGDTVSFLIGRRFGRDLGASRRRDYPMGMAARGYFSSPMSKDPFLESQLDMRDDTGATMPGYGWVFPLGDGVADTDIALTATATPAVRDDVLVLSRLDGREALRQIV